MDMFKRKCPGCANKIERKFSFCPWCGHSLKTKKENEEFGLIGRTDNVDKKIQNQNMPLSGLPFGLEKMVGPLIKQLERELSNMDKENNRPQGFNIRIQTGFPNELRIHEKQKKEEKIVPKISDEEAKRRQNLPKKEAESKVKRLSDKII
jgi:hypothetical protein